MEAVRDKKRTKKRSQYRVEASSSPFEDLDPDPVIPEDFSSSSFEVVSPEATRRKADDKAEAINAVVVSEEKEKEFEEMQNEPEEFINVPSAPPPIVEEIQITPQSEAAATPTDEVYKLPDLSELQREQACEQLNLPSAPELCDLDFYQIQQINRSILSEIQQIQSQQELKQPLVTIQLHPFTDQERNQYYFNPKLGTVMSFEILSKNYFVDQFDQMRKGHLFRELEAYFDLQSGIHNLNMDISQLKDAFPKIRKKIWTTNHTSQTFSQKCCQAFVSESVTVTYLTGTYNENWATSFKDSLANYTNICCETHRGKVILRDLQMLSISTLIQEIIDNSSVTPRRDELRLTLTTLFHFVVKQTATKDFRENVKNWLERILVVFNKFSLLDDQLFLMSHILRCPTEAALQVVKAVNISQPGKAFDAEVIDDWLAILWYSLRPIRQWQKKGQEHATEKGTNWEIVDSEGEDADEDGEEMKYPNELIFLEVLDRMPLSRIFECSLNVQEMGDAIYLSAHNILRLIIFSSAFVAVVTEGLANYQKERYKTFLKRLAGIVKWNADLVTALYDLYRSGDYPKDDMVVVRLTTEYNIFMIRVVDHLSKNRSVLQYLSQLNFQHLDTNTFWKLNYYLLTTFPEDVSTNYHDDFRKKMKEEFNFLSSHCTISQWSPEELYFILETLSSLAMGCGERDSQFMEHIVQSLFHMGYVLEMVREKCYKSVRDLLMAVTGSYPSMIQVILRDIQLNLSEINNQSLYMLKVLPYDNWRPSMETVDAISDMLENYPLDSVQHNIGKLLISYMNWGQMEEDGQTVLGHEYHCKAAMVVLSATIKKFPRPEAYRRISLAGVDADPEKRYIAWAWKMITKLKLHSMDQNAVAKLQKIENNSIQVIPMMKMEFIPTMKRLVEEEKNPLAIYIALLMCDIGNVTAEVLGKGLSLLAKLLDGTPMFIITRCLDLIVPLFLNTPDELIKSEDCAKVIESILMEERSLLGLQLSWKANETVEQFTEMVVSQILALHSFGWEIVQKVTWIWVMLLTKNPAWHEKNNHLYVLESILKISATIPGLLDSCREYLHPLNFEWKLKNIGCRKTLIPKNMTLFPWCTLIFIELDFNCYEKVTNIWMRIVTKTSAVEGKKNLNQIVKDLAKDYGAGELSVFRWADFLFKLERNSPVFSVALVQYWRLIQECEAVIEYNPGQFQKLKVKLMAKEKAEEDKDATVNQRESSRRKISLFAHVAERKDSTLANSMAFLNSFVLDYIHMPSLRDEVKQSADHWKLIAFRQEIKRRATPSHPSQGISIQIPLKEKRLRILEMVKSQKDPEVFTVPSVEFHVDKVLRKVRDKPVDLRKLLKNITEDYSETMRLVDKQKQLEFQLYIQRLISYTKTKRCQSCHHSVGIPVKYKELVKSSDNGDGNMALLMNIDTDDKTLRDEAVVIYFFSVLYQLRIGASKCEEGDHSKCEETLKRTLTNCSQCEGDVMKKFNFIGSVFGTIKERMRVIMRRHCQALYTDTMTVIYRNPTMGALLMEVLDPEQMDDGMYLRALQHLIKLLRDIRTLESCLARMKIGDRASREGITESYRMSIIKFVFTKLPDKKDAIFELLSKEVFIVMLRRIDLMPEVMHLCFESVPVRISSNLIISLLNVLGLASGDEMLRSDFRMSLERVDQIDHLFTYESIDAFFGQMAQHNWPDVVPNEGAFIAFFELMVYLLIRKNVTDGFGLLHAKVVSLYQKFIPASEAVSCKQRVTGFFKSLRYLPEDKYLGAQLRYYLTQFKESPELHKIYAAEMRELPWHRFAITANDLTEIYRVLRQTSVLQGMCSDVVVKVNWTEIFELFREPQCLNMMFFVALRVPYELKEEMKDKVLKFYEVIEKFPWHMVDEKVYSETLDWIVLSYSQMAFIPSLGREGKTMEMGMFQLLLKGAAFVDGVEVNGLQKPWVELKRRKLISAMIRLFAMSESRERSTVLEAMKVFLNSIANRIDPNDGQELEYFHGQLGNLLDEKALNGPYLSVLQDHILNSDNEGYLKTFLRSLAYIETVTKARAKLFECLLKQYFQICVGDDRNPWRTIENVAFQFIIKLRLDYLKDMELYLSLHLLIACNLKMCTSDQQRAVFIDDLINWLPNIQFNEANEVYLLLLWSQITCCAANLYERGSGAALLEKAEKYLKSTSAVRNAGWGKSLFSAIGLGKMQKQELCVGYIIYLLIKLFPELRESSTESSVKFAQLFEADLKSSKVSNFQTELNLLFGSGSGQTMVPDGGKEEFRKALVAFMWRLNPQQSGWFQTNDFWCISSAE